MRTAYVVKEALNDIVGDLDHAAEIASACVSKCKELQARLTLAVAVCEAFDAVRGGLMPSPQSSEYATRCYNELWRELLQVFGKYLAGKENDDGDEGAG